MKTIGEIFLFLSVLAFIYGVYQLIRNEFVYRIRIKWIEEDDIRHDQYSYDYMFNPSKHNLFGLKFPTDKAFPFL